MRNFYLKLLVFALFISANLNQVFAQTPIITNGAPSENFVGEQVCFTATIVNSGAGAGYGPYMRLVLPPGITFNTVDFMSTPLTPVPFTGTDVFDGATDMDDPITGEKILAADLTAGGHGAGSVVTVFRFPVGSVVSGGPELVATICATIEPTATVGVPLPVSVQPAYEFGNTATGAGGPIVGSASNKNLTPILYKITKTNNAPLGDRPPGSSWPIEFTVSVDIANGQTINNMVLTDALPTNLQFVDVTSLPAGFAPNPSTLFDPTSPLRTAPGGTVVIENNSAGGITGNTSGGEIVFTYTAYITDILNPANCTNINLQNNASFYADYLGATQPTEAASSQVQATHITAVESATPTLVAPGNIVTYTLHYRVEDFADGDGGTIEIKIPDGLDFLSHGTASTPVGVTEATTGPIAGVTTVTYTIPSTAMRASTQYEIIYQAEVLQNYAADGAFAGQPVLSNDNLTNDVSMNYDMAGGASGCNYDKVSTTVSLPEVAIKKEVVSSGPYSPGDNVTYRLTMTIPTGDSRGIYFEDYFPLPVIDVNNFDLNTDLAANTDLSFDPSSDLTTNPTSITVDAQKNMMRIEWPDIDQPAGPYKISILIDATITTDPFSDGLFHSNFMEAATENTKSVTSSDVDLVAIEIASPELAITKGVVSSDNPTSNATITPIASPVDANITKADAGDVITFAITVENIGGANAFDVTVRDIASPAASFINKTVVSILDGDGTDISGDFSGDLFSAGGLKMNSIASTYLPKNDNSDGIGQDMIIITYTAEVDVSVTPEIEIENTAYVTWAASPGHPSKFDPIDDEATVGIESASLVKSINAITPTGITSGNNVVAGQEIEYKITIDLPEGSFEDVVLTDVMTPGLTYVSGSIGISSPSGDVSIPVYNVNATDDSGGTDNEVVITFSGDIINSNTDDGVLEQLEIVYKARVEQDAAYPSGTSLNNNVQVDWISGTTNGPSPNLTVKEADLEVSKGISSVTSGLANLSPSPAILPVNSDATDVDAGDRITYKITVRNTSADAPATDVRIIDPELAGKLINYTLTSVTLDGADITGLVTGSLSTGLELPSVSGVASVIPENEEVIVTYTADVGADIEPGEDIVNQATIRWKPSPDDGVDITVTDNATATVRETELVKSLISIAPNSSGNLTEAFKGEVLTYRLIATLPEGKANTLTVVDILDAGLSFGSITSVTVSDAARITTTKGAWNTTNIIADVVGQSVTFDLGDVTTTGLTVTNDNEETITIEYEVNVQDIPANIEGSLLNNNAELRFDDPNNPGGTSTQNAQAAEVTVIQPSLSITKGVAASTNLAAELTISPDPTIEPVNGDISQSDAGDEVTFVVTLENTSAFANAYTVRVEDQPLLAGSLINYNILSVTQGDKLTNVPYSGNFNAGTFAITNPIPANTGAVGDPHKVIITYTAEVASLVDATQTITNRSTVLWRPTATAVTDLTESEDATVTMEDVSMTKTLKSITPNSTTNLNEVQVGEVLTYRIEVNLPESEMQNVRITDVLDAGLAYQAASLSFVNDALVTNSLSTELISGQTITFDLGTVANANTDADAGNDKLILEYEVLVENIPANTPGTTLGNTASFAYDNPNGAGRITKTDNANDVTVVAPDLDFTHGVIQTTDAGIINPTPGTAFPEDGDITGGASAGDVVTLRLTIENNSDVAASNLEITVPALSALSNYTITSVRLNDGVTTYTAADYTGDLNTGLNFTPNLAKNDNDSDPDNTGDDVLIIEYTVEVTDDALMSGTLVDNAEITWTSSTGTVEYGPEADAARITLGEPSVAKTVTDIMPISTGTTEAQSGESIRYEVVVTVPAGTAKNLQLVDVVNPKMSFDQVVSITRSSTDIESSIGNGFDPAPGTIATSASITNFAGTDDRLQLTFGNITNSNVVDAAVERITIVYDVLVGNTVVTGETMSNFVTLSWEDDLGTTYTETTQAPDVTIVAPDLVVTKGVSGTNGGGGFTGASGFPEDRNLVNAEVDDEVTFVITIQNQGDGKATSVKVTDPQIAGLGDYEVLSVEDGDGVDISGNFDGTVLGTTSDLFGSGLTLSAGNSLDESNLSGSDVIVITYDAKVTTVASLSGTLVNTATATWRTTTGTDPTFDFGPVQDQASVTVVNPDLTKTVNSVAPQIAPGMPGSSLVQPGEVITYEVNVLVPAGTSQNVELRDILDDGLLFEEGTFVTSVDITVNNAQVTTSIAGGFAAIEASAPTSITDENLGAGLVDNILTLNFGTLTNSNVVSSETIRIEYTVKVADDATGAVNNTAEWSWEDAGGTPYSVDGSAPEYTVVEPDLAIVHGVSDSDNPTAKATLPASPATPINDDIVSSDAGDKVTFTVTITNSGDGTGNALKLKIPTIAGLTSYDVQTITDGAGNDLFGTGFVLADRNDIFTATGLPMSGSLGEDDGSGDGSNIIILTYEAELLTSVQPGEVLTSNAQIEWKASPDGYDATSSSANDDASVTVSDLLIAKSILSIVPNNAPLANEVQPGETVTYQLIVTLPEATAKGGATNNVLVGDIMSDGLSYVPGSISITASSGDVSTSVIGGFTAAESAISVSDAAGGTSNQIEIDLETVTNTNTDDAVTETITITYEAKVNTGAAGTLSNNATISWQDPANPAGAPLSKADAAPNVSVVAPNLQIAKGISASSNASASLVGGAGFPENRDLSGAQAGDVITYKITIENIGDGAAVDVALEDPVVPIAGLGSPTLVSVLDGDGNPVAYTGTLAAGTFQLTNPVAADDGSITPTNTGLDVVIITYTATVSTGVKVKETVTNTAGVSWKTAPSEAAQPQVTETASFTNGGPLFSLSRTGIAPGYAAAGQVHIGEIITYEAVMTVAQGVTDNVVLDAQLAAGLAFVDVVSITANGAVTSSNGALASITPTVGNVGGGTANDARSISFDFGDVTNSDADADDETITVTYRAAVINSTANTRGTGGLNSSATLNWEDALSNPETANSSTGALVVAESELEVSTSFAQPDIGDAETVQVTITVEHTGASNADAFDVSITDLLPAELAYDGGGITVVGAVASSSGVVGQQLDVVIDELALGDVATITFGVTSTGSMDPCETVADAVTLRWESLKDTDQAALPVAPYAGLNGYAAERTGVAADIGEAGANDYEDTATDNIDDEDILAAGVTISVTGDDCEGEVLTLSTTAIPGASYAWFKGGAPVGGNSNTLSFTPLAAADADDYTVQVSLGVCAPVTSAIQTVAVNAKPVVTASTSHVACDPAGATLQLFAAPVSGGGGYSFSWTGPNGFTSTDQNPIIVSPTVANEGTYYVTMTDVFACASAQSSVAVSIGPDQPTLTSNGPLCEGASLTLTTPVVAGTVVTYNWSFVDDATSTPTALAFNSNSITINNVDKTANAGVYTVSVTRDGCTSPVSVGEGVTINEAPNLTVTPTLTVCDGDNIDLSFTTTNPAGTYSVQWTHASGFSSTAINPSINSADANYLAGDYTVTLTSLTTPACPVSATVSVDIPSPAKPDIAAAVASICDGTAIQLTTTSACGGGFEWQAPSGTIIPTGAAAPSLNIASANAEYQSGNWRVRCIDVNGCVSDWSDPVPVTIKPTPATPVIAGLNSICENENLTLTTTDFTGAGTTISYTWYLPGGTTQVTAIPELTVNNVAIGSDDGNYQVGVTIDGCVSANSANHALSIDALPAAFVPTNAGPICPGSDLQLTANVVATAYEWYDPDNNLVAIVADPLIPGSSVKAGDYTLIAYNASNCSTSGVTRVELGTVPSTPVLTKAGGECEGSTLTINASTYTGTTVVYEWTFIDDATSTPTVLAETSPTLIINNVDQTSHAGQYIVKVTVDGCQSAASLTEQVVIDEIPTVTAGNTGPYCNGTDIQLTATPGAAGTYTYAWSGPDGFTSSQQNVTIVAGTSEYKAGTYTVTITSANGSCTAQDVTSVVLNQPAKPALSAVNSAVCDGNDIQLAATPGYTNYYWLAPDGVTLTTNGANAHLLTVSDGDAQYLAGAWTVKVEDAATCQSEFSDAVSVALNAKPVAIASNNGPVCEGNDVTLTGNELTDADYAWYTTDPTGGPATPFSTDRIAVVSGLTNAGGPYTYYLQVTVGSCVSDVATTTVQIDDPSLSTVAIDPVGAICEGETIALTATTTGNDIVAWVWSGPNGFSSTKETPAAITAATTTDAGVYTLTVITDNGCTITDTENVTVNAKPAQPVLTAASLEVCMEESIELSTTAVADTYEWVAPNGNVVTTAVGSLTIPDGDANYLSGDWKVKTGITATGCESDYSTPISITIKSKPVAIPSNSGPICESSDVTLFGNSVNNAGYAWYEENTTTPGTPGNLISTDQNETISGLTFAGSPYKYYLVITTDGCESDPVETEVTVTDPNVDVLAITGDAAICEGASITLSPDFTSNSGATLTSYVWTGPNGFTSTQAQPSVITNATVANAGTYYLTVGTSSGCTLSTTFAVTVNAKPAQPVLTAASLEVCMEEPIELSTTAVADTYEWVAPNGNIVATTVGSLTIPDGNVNYLSGDWKVKTGITATGCESDYSTVISITIKSKPVAIPSNSGPICESSDVTLFGNSVNNAGYAWYAESTTTPGTPGNLISTDQNETISGLTFAGSPYKYYLIITTDGCESDPVETEVIVTDPNIDVLAITGDAAICEGASITLSPDFTSNSGASLTSYEWTGPNGFKSTDAQPPVITGATIANAGTYYLTVGTSGGCTLSTDFTVVVNAKPAQPVLTATSLEVCKEQSIELATTVVADTYEWVAPNGNVVNTVTGSLTIPDGDVNYLSGDWKVKVGNTTTNCESDYSAPISITIKSKPVAIPSNSGPICESSDVTLFGNSVNNAGYAWYAESTTTPGTPGNLISTDQNTVVPDLTFAGSPYKYYLIITTDGCESDPVETEVIVTDPNVDVLAITGDAAICEGASITLSPDFTSNSGATLTSYVWTGPNGFTSTQAQPSVITNATVANAGTYNLTVGTSSGCTLSTTFDVVVNAKPTQPVLTATSLEVCKEQSIELATTAVADTYEWVAPNGNVVTTAVGSLTIPDGDVNYLSGDWKVKVGNTTTNCESDYSAPISITIKSKPVAIPSNSGPICESSDVTLFGNSVNNAGYAWYAESTTTPGTPGNLISTDQNETISGLTFAGSPYKYYLIITTDGCESDPVETEVIVTDPNVDVLAITGDAVICEDASITLSSDFTSNSGASLTSYEWTGPNGFKSTDAQPPVITDATVANEGTYYLTVGTSSGCTLSTTFDVVVNAKPTQPVLTATSLEVCKEQSIELATTAVADTYEWVAPNGNIVATTVGSLTIPDGDVNYLSGDWKVKTGITATGCESDYSTAISITIKSKPVAIPSNSGPICESSDVTLFGNSVNNAGYAWYAESTTMPGMPGQLISTNQNAVVSDLTFAGSPYKYYLIITTDGCESDPVETEVNVIDPATVVPPVLDEVEDKCEGEVVRLSSSTQAEGYEWIGPNGFRSDNKFPPAIENLSEADTGYYYLTVTYGTGCSATDSVHVGMIIAPEKPLISSNNPICVTDLVIFETNEVVDVTGYVWYLPDGRTITTATHTLELPNAEEGDYYVTHVKGSCESEPSRILDMKLVDTVDDNAYAGVDKIACGEPAVVELVGNIRAGLTGRWSTMDADPVITHPTEAQTIVTNLQPGNTYEFVWTLENSVCGTISRDTILVAVLPPPVANTDSVESVIGEVLDIEIFANDSLNSEFMLVTITQQPKHGFASVNNDFSVNYEPEAGFAGRDTLIYTICPEVCDELCDTAMVIIKVELPVEVTEIITPNFDGFNDYLEVKGLENFPNNNLLVFNRWGNKVFESDSYQNDWAGTYNGNPLPDGTYYYVLKNKETGEALKAGFFTLHR
ncbi:isopeptide-forming domain-containing fimbrial protein [Flammeovirgaceae bacterium SG7u.111]|nr:isopeptide-forming domain-containing fimbrial protein [Flammeovirgaceae bacterium SG7u.132]WPO36680.1 isopeptide-forming domain-containing fimbrial protein [Flammeovirgaceae bacterium SG7u.111]